MHLHDSGCLDEQLVVEGKALETVPNIRVMTGYVQVIVRIQGCCYLRLVDFNVRRGEDYGGEERHIVGKWIPTMLRKPEKRLIAIAWT